MQIPRKVKEMPEFRTFPLRDEVCLPVAFPDSNAAAKLPAMALLVHSTLFAL